jgi:predicted DsbA family dithiol-disulfide isomerase
MSPVEITYFSDVLCVWAYVSQVRVDAIKSKFGNDIDVKYRLCSVFGNTVQKISSSWKDQGGYEGFNAHLREVAGKYPRVAVHPKL